MIVLNQYSPESGDAVAVVWKKADGLARGGTEGVVLGILGDDVSGEYLVIDRSTYQDAFKSALFSLGILDLMIIPVAEIESIRATDLRKRPPGVYENLKWNVEVDYKSNVDYDETVRKLQHRTDCKVEPNQPVQTDGYCGITILNFGAVEGAKILISPKGNVQVFCLTVRLDECVKWLQEAVEVLPDHKHLVLIPTHFMFNVHDIFKEAAYPTEEVIDRIAKTEGNQPIILALGWVHEFFAELDKNPLQTLFPSSDSMDDLVLIHERNRKAATKTPDQPAEKDSAQSISFVFPKRQVTFNRYLGAGAPIMRITGLIKSAKDEEGLMQMWLDSRSDPWQWLDSEQIHGKTIIHDLTIDRKTGVYTVDFRKYSGNEF